MKRNKTLDIMEFTAPVQPYPNATKEELDRCVDVLTATLDGNVAKATAECNQIGSMELLVPKTSSSSIQHVFIQKHILNETFSDCKFTNSCFSNGTSPDLRFAVIYEGDSFIPVDGLLRIVELLLQSYPDRVGLYLLCDSYHSQKTYNEPHHLQGTIYTNSFPTVKSRTVNAYLISQDTLQKWFGGGKYIPLTRPIDHQFNFMIKSANTLTHNAFPPIACHGSLYIDADLAANEKFFDNLNSPRCSRCCERYYHIPSMKPKTPRIELQKNQPT